jgi:hypothetical protein
MSANAGVADLLSAGPMIAAIATTRTCWQNSSTPWSPSTPVETH